MEKIKIAHHRELSSKKTYIAYWFFTILVSIQIIAGAILDLSQNNQFKITLLHLGYPLYILPFLGVFRVAALIIILLPKMQLVKEWVYAGIFAELAMATISHIAVGDPFSKWIMAALFAFITIASWYLRPANRKLIFNVDDTKAYETGRPLI